MWNFFNHSLVQMRNSIADRQANRMALRLAILGFFDIVRNDLVTRFVKDPENKPFLSTLAKLSDNDRHERIVNEVMNLNPDLPRFSEESFAEISRLGKQHLRYQRLLGLMDSYPEPWSHFLSNADINVLLAKMDLTDELGQVLRFFTSTAQLSMDVSFEWVFWRRIIDVWIPLAQWTKEALQHADAQGVFRLVSTLLALRIVECAADALQPVISEPLKSFAPDRRIDEQAR
ncbi:MAG TPA: hypothetical protein PKC25_12110, partial [Candidatus Rifleibacterium sp.]|nr:hypothetical protein [Candidatus Rifleibacterium sp.]